FAKRSSMCSRNGTPMETLDCPLPSRLSSTRMSVCFVLRWTVAIRDCMVVVLATDFTDCIHYLIVFFRRSKTKPKVISQHRITADVAHENVVLQQVGKNATRIRLGLHHHEVSFRRHGSQAFNFRQLSKQSLAFSDDLFYQWTKLAVVVFHRNFSGDLCKQIYAVRQHRFANLAHQRGRGEQVTHSQSGKCHRL